MMTWWTATEHNNSNDHNSTTSIDLVDMIKDPIEVSLQTPPTKTTNLLDTLDSPTTVLHVVGTPSLPGNDDEDDDISEVSYDIDDQHSTEEDNNDESHQSLEELISKSLSEIEGVMGEIMSETSSSSSLQAKLRKRKQRSNDNLTLDGNDEEEEDIFIPAPTELERCSTMESADPAMNLRSLQTELNNASVMADVDRISTELEETRKNAEELKTKIGKLRSQLAHRRELRNRIEDVSKIVVEESS